LDEAKLAFGVVRDINEFATSEWSQWWGAIDEVDNRTGGTLRIPGKPWRFSHDKLDHPGVPAYRGEHNAEILSELGIPAAEISRMTDIGAVTADPRPPNA
jgi:crotonobetainyl-CoA:carnitine CoA-transferase CaiB-like acyl-CoA transferase